LEPTRRWPSCCKMIAALEEAVSKSEPDASDKSLEARLTGRPSELPNDCPQPVAADRRGVPGART